MIITIFGGSGEIGSSLAKKFKDSGNIVYTITSDRNKLNQEHVYWDYRTNEILKIISITDVVIISISPIRRKSNFINEGYTNINKFLNSISKIIEYIKLSKNKIKLIFFSSAVVYPHFNNASNNTKININIMPAHPYELIGISLRLAENIITSELITNCSISILRLSTIYGELRESTLFTGIINDLITKIMIEKKIILIDCNQKLKRNFLHISDLFNIINRNILTSTNSLEIKNISSNTNTSMFKLSKIIYKHTKSNAKISFNNEKFASSRLIKPDISIENYKFIDLDTGINSIINNKTIISDG